MPETHDEIKPAPPKTDAPASFQEVLRGFVGKVVTCVNPESYEEAAVGQRLKTGFYRAKVLNVGTDYLTVATEFQHKRGEQVKEPVKQFIPFAQIKRVSVMKSDRLIHL